jgi:hypothetical protein
MEQVARQLRAIDSVRDHGNWWTQPLTIMGGLTVDFMSKPRPAIAVLAVSAEDTAEASPRHESNMEFEIHAITSEVGDPHKAINELVSDIVKAMAIDESVGGLAEVLTFVKWETDVQFGNGAGIGSAKLIYRVVYKWTHDSP